MAKRRKRKDLLKLKKHHDNSISNALNEPVRECVVCGKEICLVESFGTWDTGLRMTGVEFEGKPYCFECVSSVDKWKCDQEKE